MMESKQDLDRIQRIHGLIKHLSTHLSETDRLVAELSWLMINISDGNHIDDSVISRYIERVHQIIREIDDPQTSDNICHVIQDAKLCDKLGPLGIPESTPLKIQELLKTCIFKTASGKRLGEARIRYMREYLVLYDLQSRNADTNAKCSLCKKPMDSDFLGCHHSYCDDCEVAHYGSVYCKLCDKTFFEDECVIYSDTVYPL